MTIKTSYAPGEPIWVDLSTPDVAQSIAYYGSLFGWTCDTSRAEEFGGYANFARDGKLVAGVMPLMQEGMPPTDQAAVLPFYAKVFGWAADVKEGYTEFQLGGTSLAGCLDMPEMAPAEVPSYWMPYFRAEDPKAKGAEAVRLGGSFVVEYAEMAEVAFSIVKDPAGAMFGLLRVTR